MEKLDPIEKQKELARLKPQIRDTNRNFFALVEKSEKIAAAAIAEAQLCGAALVRARQLQTRSEFERFLDDMNFSKETHDFIAIRSRLGDLDPARLTVHFLKDHKSKQP